MTHPGEVDRTPSAMAPSARRAGRSSPTGVIRLLGGLATLLILGFAVLAPGTADAKVPPGNNGTVKVHEGASDTEPIVKNEPHVVCSFHLHFFFADPAQSGDWKIKSWPPTGDKTAVLTGTYLSDSNGEYMTVEYTLAAGHYKVYWKGDEAKLWKHKVFWVEPCAPPPTPTPTATATPEVTATPTATATPEGTVAPTATATATPTATPAGAVEALTAKPKHTLPVTAMDGIETSATVNLRPLLILGSGLLTALLWFLPSDRIAARRRR